MTFRRLREVRWTFTGFSPVVTAVIERAMPVFEPGEPPPHVLDFTLYATAGES